MEQPVVGERKWKQPVGQQLPLTPPATVEKPLRAEKCGQIKPRKLLKQLKNKVQETKVKVQARAQYSVEFR